MTGLTGAEGEFLVIKERVVAREDERLDRELCLNGEVEGALFEGKQFSRIVASSLREHKQTCLEMIKDTE